jgi:hypothetical protein
VFENRVLRRILRAKRNEGVGGWRKMHNKVLLYLYSLPSIIRIMQPRRMRLTVHVARMGEKRNAYRLLVGKPEGRTPLGRPKCRWVDKIKMDLRDRMGWCGLDWSGSQYGQVESSCECSNERTGSRKCWGTIE